MKLNLIAAGILIAVNGLTGCVVGRLDSDHLRIIPASEVHRMDNKGFPLNFTSAYHEDSHYRPNRPIPSRAQQHREWLEMERESK